jgi:hypothetical protein
MFFFIFGVDQYIIDEHHNKLVQILHKDLVHQIHKVGRYISQSKRYHCILVQTIPQNKSSLRYVTVSDFQLMISQSKIDLREYACTLELIKLIINPRQRVLVFDGNLIQGMIIQAQPLSTILLWDKNHRSSPWG